MYYLVIVEELQALQLSSLCSMHGSLGIQLFAASEVDASNHNEHWQIIKLEFR